MNLIPEVDSRKVINPARVIFFALKGEVHDGHDFIPELIGKGVKSFVVDSTFEIDHSSDSTFTVVDDVLFELQKYATQIRDMLSPCVVGITGSNGKTIVKEWLSSLLEKDETLLKSPRSFNSQIGVPLSVGRLNSDHSYAIFEAGISKEGEMAKLNKIISPNHGIFTNIGSAHSEGFSSIEKKVEEKAKLFAGADSVVYCKDYTLIEDELKKSISGRLISWSLNNRSANYFVKRLSSDQFEIGGDVFHFQYTDSASIENLIHCIVYIKEHYDLPQKELQSRLNKLVPVEMRLELKEGRNNCRIIDDSYNNDFIGLQVALEFLNYQSNNFPTVVILSDVYQIKESKKDFYRNVANLIDKYKVGRFIGVGKELTNYKDFFIGQSDFFDCTSDFIQADIEFDHQAILVKGARSFEFEKIIRLLSSQRHKTVMKVDLNALANNLSFYRSQLKSETKLMVMLKAFGYGSGSYEVGNLLEKQGVDYLAVAYADEGVELRDMGVRLPIMVMNPQFEDFDMMVEYNLEPELFSRSIMMSWFSHVKYSKVHLKFDTGMHRLGFDEEDVDWVINKLHDGEHRVASVFTHLSSADLESEKEYTLGQLKLFSTIVTKIEKSLGYDFLRHALNSSGILRYPDFQFDMVRLGIGLYGFDPNSTDQDKLRSVVKLETVISQIKHISKGSTIGYARKGNANRDMKVATIAIGYADGYSRRFSNGVGEVLINDERVKVIGNVCMDMTMVDVTDIDCNEGDVVEVFGERITIMELSEKLDTIPYEVLTSVSQRVKRLYIDDV